MPAMKVWVPQAPKGAEALSRVPHFELPRKRVMLVLTLVSSIARQSLLAAMRGNEDHTVWGSRDGW